MKLPTFTLLNQAGQTVTNADLSQGNVILYAYPADFTPGCTLEAQDFARLHQAFAEAGFRLVGISPDKVDKHQKFCDAEGLPFDLLSDPDHTLMEALGAWGEKNLYGKKVVGVKRSTFVIRDGTVVHTFSNVKAKGHAEKVLRHITS